MCWFSLHVNIAHHVCYPYETSNQHTKCAVFTQKVCQNLGQKTTHLNFLCSFSDMFIHNSQENGSQHPVENQVCYFNVTFFTLITQSHCYQVTFCPFVGTKINCYKQEECFCSKVGKFSNHQCSPFLIIINFVGA